LLLVAPQRAATRPARVALVALACAVTVTVAAAVIGLRWHYLTDTMAGADVGVAAVITLALLLDLGQGRYGAPRRAPAALAPRARDCATRARGRISRAQGYAVIGTLASVV
jgi:membrane-associated phospholipid phosphatase